MSAIPHAAAVRMERGTAVFGAIVALAAIVVALFHQSFAAIWELWQLSTYQYAFLVLPAAVYLIWSQRRELAVQAIAPAWGMLAVLVLLTLAWLVGRATAVQAVEHTAAVLAVPAIVLTVLGRRVAHTITFPLILLLTLIPVGEVLTPTLMVITAEIASGLLKLFGVPFTRDGQFISLAGGNFLVADVCSGVRYLLASVVLSLLFGYLHFRSIRKRALFMAVTAVIFIVGNGVRAFIVMTVASATNMKYFGGRDHVIFGMIFFAVLLLALFWLGSRYADPLRQDPIVASEPGVIQMRKIGAALLAAVAVLVAGLVLQAQRAHAAVVPDLRLPVIAGCEPPTAWQARWSPSVKGADAQQLGSYRCGEAEIHVMIVSYVNQRRGKELVGTDNAVVPSEWWQLGAQTRETLTLRDGSTLPVNQTHIVSPADSMIAWHWYAVNGRATPSGSVAKLYEALAALAFRPIESRAYVVSVEGPAGRWIFRGRRRRRRSTRSTCGAGPEAMDAAVADGRPLIAHLVFRFDYGGLENGIVNLVNGLPAGAFRPRDHRA